MKLFTFREHLKQRRSFTPDEYTLLQSRLINARQKNQFPNCWRRLWNLFSPQEQNELTTDCTDNTDKEKSRSGSHPCSSVSSVVKNSP